MTHDTRSGRLRRPLKETPQYATLVCLGCGAAINRKELAKRLHYSEGAIAIHLKSLRKHGYVEMVGTRRKGTTYTITAAGRLALAA